ncbi:MAG: class I SAM-dependent methyltransferase [Bacteroidia bacterium]|nr:class I SAM-dependent methyltransferase [Bacteroidia bacterium]
MHRAYGLGKRLLLFVQFWISAKSYHSVHSPMVFDLIQRLRKVRDKRTKFARIEALRKKLTANETLIEFNDLGNHGEPRSRSISSIAKRSAKSPAMGLVLSEIVEFVRPEVGIELGTSLGLSLAYQVTANPNMQFFSLEGSPEIAEIANRNLSELGIRANLRIGNFDDVLHPLLEELETVDYVFVDGNHQLEPTLRYFELIISHMPKKGCIVFDDIYWSEGMRQAWTTIIADDRVAISIDLYHLGIVFIRDGVEKQHFKLRL